MASTMAVPKKLRSMAVDVRSRKIIALPSARGGERHPPFLDLLESLGIVEIEARAGHLVAETRFVHQLRQRSRIGTTRAAVLDEDHHHDLRILTRREGSEPGVIAILERQR